MGRADEVAGRNAAVGDVLVGGKSSFPQSLSLLKDTIELFHEHYESLGVLLTAGSFGKRSPIVHRYIHGVPP